MTEMTEKARIGAPSAAPVIDGFTEEGENLSPLNAGPARHTHTTIARMRIMQSPLV